MPELGGHEGPIAETSQEERDREMLKHMHLCFRRGPSRLLKNYWGRSTSSWGQRQA